MNPPPVTQEKPSRGHWPAIARMWEQVGSPLRPCEEDLGFFQRTVVDWSRENGAPRVLILGVTQELFRLDWPTGTRLLAIDQTMGMIDALWPGPRGGVLCGDWTALPLDAGSRDIVLCDGGLHLLSYPVGQGRLVAGLRRVLTHGGLFILRLYVPPKEHESIGVVLADLMSGKVRDLNILKLRLGMSLQRDAGEGVGLSRVWQTLHDAAPDLEGLAARIGWTVEHMLAIHSYRDSPNRYHFVSVDEVRAMFESETGGFELLSEYTPRYELGECCPMVVLRRKGEGA